jgi:hypothetical protein
LDAFIARVPNVDVGGLVRGATRGVGSRDLLLDPEEHAPAALSFRAAATSGIATRTLSFSRIFSTSLPLRTARELPASLQAMRL